MKQVILVRKDLHMPPGKLAAQCCHASVETVLKSDRDLVDEWKREGMTKIVLGVNNQEDLTSHLRMAKQAGLVCVLIKDAARTFFSEPTVTCLGIGPDEDGKIDRVTGHLSML